MVQYSTRTVVYSVRCTVGTLVQYRLLPKYCFGNNRTIRIICTVTFRGYELSLSQYGCRPKCIQSDSYVKYIYSTAYVECLHIYRAA